MNPIDIASHGPVIPVIVIDRVEDALPLAEALLAGGVKVLEVTLRTAAGLPAIEAIARNLPEAVVGVGTVLHADDARRASEAGARFAVSPGYTSEVGGACKGLNLPLLPGVATSSEIMAALADGFSFLKLFPAEAAGGIPLLKAWASPFGQVSFCPTGGISLATAPNYLALRGRFVADARRRRARGRLGAHHPAGARDACAAQGRVSFPGFEAK